MALCRNNHPCPMDVCSFQGSV